MIADLQFACAEHAQQPESSCAICRAVLRLTNRLAGLKSERAGIIDELRALSMQKKVMITNFK